MQNCKRRGAASATRSFANLVCRAPACGERQFGVHCMETLNPGQRPLVLPPRRPSTVIHFNVARLSESLSASIETLSVDELQPGSDVANRGGRPITDYKHAACFFDWLGAASPRTVKRCLAHGSQHVLWIMWMAHPNQADRPQGSHHVSDGLLTANDPGIGSGWQQSKQNWARPAVVGH